MASSMGIQKRRPFYNKNKIVDIMRKRAMTTKSHGSFDIVVNLIPPALPNVGQSLHAGAVSTLVGVA